MLVSHLAELHLRAKLKALNRAPQSISLANNYWFIDTMFAINNKRRNPNNLNKINRTVRGSKLLTRILFNEGLVLAALQQMWLRLVKKVM